MPDKATEDVYEDFKLMLKDPQNDTERVLAPLVIKLSDRIYDLEKRIEKEEVK